MLAPEVLFKLPEGRECTIRYYSLARYALLEALRLMDIGPGKRVLLPSFVCRDLLAPIVMLGAEPRWYEVGADLAPVASPDGWPEAEVVLAINYFGFAQELKPFVEYSQRTGAKLVEDNAHGYLSRDTEGAWLGTRAPIGLLSLRKTLRIPDGAALLLNEPALAVRAPAQIPLDGVGINPAQALKSRMRQIPLVGGALLRASTLAARAARKWRTGSAIPAPDPASESEIPAGSNPWTGLPNALAEFDVPAEVVRRRQAYAECAREGERIGVLPVFPALPDNCAPYGFPFRSHPSGRAAMQRQADQMGFDLVTWPDLPGACETTAPSYYRDVFLVNFLW